MHSPSQSENPDPDSSPLQHPQKPDPTRLIADQEEQEEEYSGMVHKSSAAKLLNRRGYNKRRLACVNQKQRAIDKKVQNLLQLGTLIPFVPLKRFDFDKHAVLFKRLGLWDFVHVEFDEVIRDDLVAQFIVSYDVVKKCCLVNGVRVNVNRSKFASVLKLPSPMKKDKVVGSVAEAAIDLDLDKVSEECIEFVEDFVGSWVVLHGGDWVMPNEVESWMGLIRDGLPEKVDWATLIWIMVENELKQRDQLRMCYYASHMQYFIKSQRKDLFDEESEDVAINEEMKEEEKALKALSEEDITKVKVDGKGKDKDLLEEPDKVDEVMMDGINLFKESPKEVEEVKKGPHEEVVVKVEGVKKDAVGSFYDLIKERDKSVLEEPNIRLTLGKPDIAQNEEIKDDTRMAVGECPVTKCGSQYSFGYENEGKHFLKPCIFGEGRGSDGNEEIKQEVGQLEMEEEHMEEGEHMEAEDVEESEGDELMDQLEAEYEDEDEEEEELKDTIECNIAPNYGKHEVGQLETEEEEYMEKGEHMEAEDVEESEGDEMMDQLDVEDEDEDEDEDEEEEEEELEDTIECNIAPNYGSVQGADLTAVLQGFKTTHLPLNLQGQQLNENSSMELFASNAEKQAMIGCPSMAGNGHKRGIACEQDTSHLDGSKRIRTDVSWDHNASDFRFCMGQVSQYMEKAKIIYEEKDRAYNQLNANQQYFLQELQQKDGIIENLKKNTNEEVHKKDKEIYRLERELDLLGELVNGYREALKVNRNIFYEYRQQCRLPEEPIYKDAGSGGLVLSTTDLEKQRQLQENEDRLKRLMIEQTYTEALEGYVKQFQALFSKVQMIDVNRLTPVVNEVKLLKELHAARHRAPQIPDCVPTETTLPSA